MRKLIKKYPLNNNYLVDDEGNIYSKRFNKKLTPKNNWDGYQRIQIWNKGNVKMVSWHRVVAETWVDNPDNKPYVNHIDGNKTNNHPSNLEWVTQKENIKHAWDNGLSNAETHSRLGTVYHFDKNKNLIEKYPSVAEASRQINMNYWGLLSKVKNEKPLTDGSIILLSKKCNDYPLKEYDNY